MKRLINLALAIALLLTMGTQMATADEDRKSGAFTYRIKGNGTATITGYDWDNMKEQDIYIPRMLDGYTVTEIADEAFAKISYDKNNVPTITHDNLIGFLSKAETKAGTLVIPDTVTAIGAKAFFGICFTSSRITIPASVQYIGPGAFSYLPNIEQFIVANGNSTFATINGALYNKSQKELIAYPLDMNKYAEDKEKIIIPDGIKSIGDYAFFGWKTSGEKTCILPNSLERIGKYAFAHATAFNRIVDTDYRGQPSPYNDGSYTLNRYDWVFPEKLSIIGEGAFYSNSDNFADGMLDLSQTQIVEIPSFAFYDGGTAETVRLPYTLEAIGNSAFEYSCGKIEAFPSGLQTIGNRAFTHYSGFENVVLPEGLETVGEDAFADCYGLSSLTLPATIRSIGDNVCDKTEVIINAPADSFVALWASENGYMTPHVEDTNTDWLND